MRTLQVPFRFIRQVARNHTQVAIASRIYIARHLLSAWVEVISGNSTGRNAKLFPIHYHPVKPHVSDVRCLLQPKRTGSWLDILLPHSDFAYLRLPPANPHVCLSPIYYITYCWTVRRMDSKGAITRFCDWLLNIRNNVLTRHLLDHACTGQCSISRNILDEWIIHYAILLVGVCDAHCLYYDVPNQKAIWEWLRTLGDHT